MKAADSETIRKVDKAALERYGLTGLQLMENAGRGVAEIALKEAAPGRVAIFAGRGNNGGDGYVAARHLRNSGRDAVVYSLCRIEELSGDAATNAWVWRKMGGEVREVLSSADLDSAASSIRHSAIIVDAIFGTGLKTEVSGIHASAIESINSLGKKTIAVDVPSGIDATTGNVLGSAVRADITATMAMPKLGLLLYPGRTYAGRVEVIDIGVPHELLEDGGIRWNVLTGADIRKTLRPRRPESHKSTHGHLLVLAGSPGMTGAAYMAAVSAMRAGAGLATVGVPERLNDIIEAKTTEVMSLGLPETREGTLGGVSFEAIKKLLPGKTAVVVGPGMRSSDEARRLIEMLLHEVRVPVVIDADGLNSFGPGIAAVKREGLDIVLTPHPGEMARLLGRSAAEVQSDRIGAAEELTRLTGATVVLKGAGTLIAVPSGEIFINPTGNPGLATAGTGDVLAGMLGGLLAQGYSPVQAACTASYIHGLAGDEVKRAQGELGMMAMDLVPEIPRLMNSFIDHA
ncbi:MAG: NAD(P)H-hydrate dehydratase [Deltaproteobacteria bacterium]|nr:NAD(P)H-hydrate dehydratase [Deltaproteobacteria bacterium]MCL4874066.1 NAD(P)H-hydrate dehydratase [bacterium]